MCEQSLHLVQHVVVDLLLLVLFNHFWLAVVDTEQVVSESGDHKELLQHRVHVANAAKVANTHVLLDALGGVWRCVVPCLWLLNHAE